MSFSSAVIKDLIFFKRKFYDQAENNVTIFSCIKYLVVPSYAIVFWYRLYSSLVCSDNKLARRLGAILYYRTVRRYSSDIHPKAKIGVPFKVGHHFGIVIGPDVVIGRGVYVFNGVTLGNKNVGCKNVMPALGDNIVIGTGSKLLGGIKIGSNSIVGANSAVLCDVGENEIWAGSPARLIRHNATLNSGFSE